MRFLGFEARKNDLLNAVVIELANLFGYVEVGALADDVVAWKGFFNEKVAEGGKRPHFP